MNRDSDGYILIDMGAADISKSTQSIVGFYDRIVESVKANKLVLVINFGTYSPMPAIAHKKLNYYEIVTNLYKITINSNDIVIIEETGESTVDVSIVPTLQEGVKIADFAIGEVEGSIYAPEQVDVINDNVTAENTTWSSDKIDNELVKKADSSSLATVATSGSYADLTNKPTLAAVATSGSYTDLTNKPTIPADLDDLSDVTLTAPANGQTLVYDVASEQFVNATPPSGVTTLAALSDVTLTTPASGNSLVFDGTVWANDTLAAADIPYSSGVSVADKLATIPTSETGTITPSSITTIIRSSIKRYGNLICFTIDFKVSSNSSWSKICDIPNDYKPSINSYFVGVNTGSQSGTQLASFQLSNTGSLNIANAKPDTNVQYSLCATWLV